MLEALLPVAGSLVGSLLNQQNVSSTNEANLKLAKYQYEKNLEMWNRQNEYNSPVAQMQRLKDAGLNPNMVYGNGSAANLASSGPSFQAPHLSAYQNYGDFGMSQIANTLLTSKQIKNVEEQNRLLQIDARSKQQEILARSLQMAKQAMENSAYRDDYNNARELSNLSVKAARSNIAKLDVDTNLAMARAQVEKLRYKLTDAQIKQIQASIPGIIARGEMDALQYKDYEEYGIRPSDPVWIRALIMALKQSDGVNLTSKDVANINSNMPTRRETLEEVKQYYKRGGLD